MSTVPGPLAARAILAGAAAVLLLAGAVVTAADSASGTGPAPVGAPGPAGLLLRDALHAESPDWWHEGTQTLVDEFYRATLYQPAWFAQGRLVADVRQLHAALLEAPTDGLPFDREAVRAVAHALGPTPDSLQALVRADLTFTAAFLQHAQALAHGVVDPRDLHATWVPGTRAIDLPAVLRTALVRGDLTAPLSSLRPPHPEYARLREALQTYTRIQQRGGWPTLPDGVLLRRDASGDHEGDRTEDECEAQCKAVERLREALLVHGDLSRHAAVGPRGVVDEALEEAVRRFQQRHGLDADGIVGPITIGALNVPVHERVRQILLNLERWRWLPDDLGPSHVRVNVPGFRLHAYDQGERRLSMRVVVGRDAHLTPVYSDEISFLVFSPYWEIPDSITRRTLLPRILEDPAYLQRQRFEIVEGWQEDADRIPPHEIDWDMKAERFPYRLRQKPGPNNAMGQVKFMFPNRFNVYLHDTPGNQAFERIDRALSHGCVRVERPVELSAWLLRHQGGWDEARIEAMMGRSSPRTVRLAQTTPVHLLYFTAWVDDEGAVQFRDDLYGHDATHASLLPSGVPALDTTAALSVE